ncbi:MAG: DUF3810 domain-containing protein [bacterium]
MKSPTKLRAGIIGLALTFYLVLQILAQFPEFVERYYSNGLYPVLTWIMTNITARFHFSLSEFMLWFVILIGIPFIIHRIRKKSLTAGRVVLNLITTVAVVYVWFYLFWGLNYYRQPLKSKLRLDEVSLSIGAFDSTLTQIIKKCNNLSFSYSILEIEQIIAEIDSSYDSAFDTLRLKKIPSQQRLKSFAFNWMLNKTMTSGWFSPWFHEVHTNSDLLIFELPFVIAHEKAHQKGFTSETEANFIAFLVCTNSDDPLCQYSGYFHTLNLFILRLGADQERMAFFDDKLNQGVRFNREEIRQRWLRHAGLISKLSRKGYDLYLKSNNVKEGIDSYAMMVDYVVRFNEQQKWLMGK